jgi:hypothetical protein
VLPGGRCFHRQRGSLAHKLVCQAWASTHLLHGQTARGNGRNSSASGLLRSSQACQSARSSTTICRLWIGATSGPGSVVRRVKASPFSSATSGHNPAKQNHPSPALVNCHFDFGDFAPVNSNRSRALGTTRF